MTIPDSELTPVTHAVISELAHAHAEAVRPMTSRRRSLTAAMTAALLASWSVVEDRLDDHLLVTMTVLNATEGGEPDRVLFERLVTGVAGWLAEFADLQAITWQTPPAQMARTLLATIDGLIGDYAVTRDSDGARQLITLLGYHLAQSGLRHTKVPPRGLTDD